MTKFKYYCMHIPSGKTLEFFTKEESHKVFIENINNWNRLGGTLWKYWY